MNLKITKNMKISEIDAVVESLEMEVGPIAASELLEEAILKVVCEFVDEDEAEDINDELREELWSTEYETLEELIKSKI